MLKQSFTWIRWAAPLALAFVLIFGATGVVHAAEFPGGGNVPAGQTIEDDVFLSAQNVSVDGTINGNLLAAGSTITINGTVNGDAFLVGQTLIVTENATINGNLFLGGYALQVKGKVTGSVFGGANNLTVSQNANIARNLYYGGYSIETQPGNVIGKDAYLGGYQAILGGEISRDLNFGGAALELNGKVDRNANLEIGSPNPSGPNYFNPTMFQQPGMPPMPAMIAQGLQIGKAAQIGGKLTYTSTVDQSSAIQAAPAGGIVYQTPVPQQPQKPQPVERRFPVLGWVFNFFRTLVTLLILGGLAVWLAPFLLRSTANQVENKPLPSAGYGFVTILAGYAAAFAVGLAILVFGILIALLSLGGLSRTFFGIGFSALAVIVTVFTLLVSYGSKVVVSYLIGDLLMKKISPQASHHSIWAMVIGVVIYTLVRSIPFIGWLIGVAVTLVGVGAMWLDYRSRRMPAIAAPVQTTAS
jgi:cytoskeletal protein CcmA (bactofilin family)